MTLVLVEFAGMFPVLELQAVAVPTLGFPLESAGAATAAATGERKQRGRADAQQE